MRVTLPDDLPDGGFRESIRFTAKPAEAGQRPRSFQVLVQGSVEGRLSFYGGKLDIDRILRLGVLQPGEAARASVLMKVNDDRPTLVVKRIEAEPSFLRVKVVRLASRSAKVGVYRIEVEVPADAPACDFADRRERDDPFENGSSAIADDCLASQSGQVGRRGRGPSCRPLRTGWRSAWRSLAGRRSEGNAGLVKLQRNRRSRAGSSGGRSKPRR